MDTTKRKELILNQLSEDNIDINKRLPYGYVTKLSSILEIEKQIVHGAIASLKRESKPKAYLGVHIDAIQKYLKDNNLDLHKRMPSGSSTELAKILKVTPKSVYNMIGKLRKRDTAKEALKIIEDEQGAPEPTLEDFKELCLKNDFIRKAPDKEATACDIICDFLHTRMTRGGAGMIIGTPTAFAASKNQQYKMVASDNLEVAISLKWTTDIIPTVVIGNSVNPEKAKLKALHWSQLSSTSKFNILLDKVDRDSYTHHVTRFAEANSFAKVIMMMSGVWECAESTRKKYGMELNFKDPSVYLSTIYPDLHILAMTRNIKKFGFSIQHVHRGKITQVE